MDLPVVDALFGTFGPFLVPVALFVLGAVGYGVLLVVTRLLATGSPRWTGAPEPDEDPVDAEGHDD